MGTLSEQKLRISDFEFVGKQLQLAQAGSPHRWTAYGEYWSKAQVEKGKERARKDGFSKLKTTAGSFIGSYTLWVKRGWESD